MITGLSSAITGGSTGVSVSDQDSNSQPQLPQTLGELLAAAGIELAAEQVELLDHYRRLLWSWNERMNLTRHTTLEKFVGRDVFDSLSTCQPVEPGRARTGRRHRRRRAGRDPGNLAAGFESQPLRIDAEKSPAVEAMVGELGLDSSRLRHAGGGGAGDQHVRHAGRSGPGSAAKGADVPGSPHWDAFDQLLLIKGPSWVEERGEARHQGLMRGLELRKAATYQTPQTGAESVILKIRRSDAAD